jgi:hypothetical protein
MPKKHSRDTQELMTKMIRSYSELIKIPTFEERFRYLKLDSKVGEDTFGFERYLNQSFYHSYEWKQIRREVIVRDMGLDLASAGREIDGLIIVHHMNPITVQDIVKATKLLLNPEYLISTCKRTHDAIHYGDIKIYCEEPVERKPNDTCPWK